MAKVKRNLRPLLRFLSLQGTPANTTLLETLAAMIEAFELGEPLPTGEVVEEARLLAQVLGTVSPIYLLCLEDDGMLNGEEQKLLDLFRQADERGRETILAVARSQWEATDN